jgi:DNA topoisomerase-1
MKKRAPLPPEEKAARAAALRYVKPCTAGLSRVKQGRSFRYLFDGRPVRDKEVCARIASLAIPPAWQNVWICADPRGHLQAVGTDARGRKQYRYHPDWSHARNLTKFNNALRFGAQLETMRAHIERDLAKPGLPLEKVLAMVVAVMDETQIRIGHAEYARQNRTYGLSTLLDRHVRRVGEGVHFVFTGKTGIKHDIKLGSRRLSRLVLRCKELPGQDLFQYLDESGTPHPIDSGMVNDHIRSITDGTFTCKDIRTWKGTVHAVQALLAAPLPTNKTEERQLVNTALDAVASKLGNTRAVCRKYYVHPLVLEQYASGELHRQRAFARPTKHMTMEERLVLRMLGARSTGRELRKAA